MTSQLNSKLSNHKYLTAIALLPSPVLFMLVVFAEHHYILFWLIWAWVSSVTLHIAIHEEHRIKWVALFLFIFFEQIMIVLLAFVFDFPIILSNILYIVIYKIIVLCITYVMFAHLQNNNITTVYYISETTLIYLSSALLYLFIIDISFL